MTPKEKAEQLFDSFLNIGVGNDWAKQCALIAVDEIINEFAFNDSDYADRRYAYWNEVKQEIEKL